MGPVVWMEGIIGAGKSTLTRLLAQRYNMRAIFEPVEENPYLSRFYEDPLSCAFAMQIELLHRRYVLHALAHAEAANNQYNGAILDRGLPGDRVFARLLYRRGLIGSLEIATYELAFENMMRKEPAPNLLIFLDVEPDVALQRVIGRGRGFEVRGLTLEYLSALRDGYEALIQQVEHGQYAWARGVRVLRVPWNSAEPKTEAIEAAIKASGGPSWPSLPVPSTTP